MPKIPAWAFILLGLLLLSNVFIPVMDVDAAQYADISREMLSSKNWLEVYDHGVNYLDKPPMLFWLSAGSMKLFGVNDFAYKFPSILFAFLAIYSTYRLTKLLYDEHTARVAAFILGCCQGMFLMTNDVRTDTILMGFVATALWMIKEAERKRTLRNVLGGTMAIAGGMMTKGPIALMVPMFCFGCDWLLKRDGKKIFSARHLVDVVLIAIFLIPMCIGLYTQYDLHPEKVIDGKTGTSGLKFFFWTQSFGRITGENSWDNGAGLDFLLVNMLWSFLPWIFLFLPALVVNIIEIFKQKFRLKPQQEWISTGGFIISYLALGLSHYQLPHYIFVAFPLAAIMVAKLLRDFTEEGKYQKLYKVFRPVMIVVTGLLFVGVLMILIFTFPAGWLLFTAWVVALVAWVYFGILKARIKIFSAPAIGIVLINIFLSHYFYRTLLQYQVGTVVGHYINEKNLPSEKLKAYRIDDPLNALYFYAQRRVRVFYDSGIVYPMHGDYILTQEKGAQDILNSGFETDTLMKGDFFKVSELGNDLNFLSAKNRYKAVKHYYFLQLK